jgi:hypothetical protein
VEKTLSDVDVDKHLESLIFLVFSAFSIFSAMGLACSSLEELDAQISLSTAKSPEFLLMKTPDGQIGGRSRKTLQVLRQVRQTGRVFTLGDQLLHLGFSCGGPAVVGKVIIAVFFIIYGTLLYKKSKHHRIMPFLTLTLFLAIFFSAFTLSAVYVPRKWYEDANLGVRNRIEADMTHAEEFEAERIDLVRVAFPGSS